ncbi:MAG: flagellar hook-associated protein 3 FlgL [Bacillota bacterium]|nr:MAG: flagellar hook-associated protein 3 FlgL [Bacillota bacterium]
MRVADNTLRNNVMRNLGRSLRELSKAQSQMSGQVISKPSDNPVVAAKLLNINAALSETAQYQSNVRDAVAWVSLTDATLDKIGESLGRAKTLAQGGFTGTTPQNSRDYIAGEIDQLLEHVVTLSNSSFDGERFLFGGTYHQGQPFALVGGVVGTRGTGAGSGAIKYEILRGIEMKVNIEGNKAFIDGGVFKSLHDLSTALRSGSDGQAAMVAVDAAFNTILTERATIGARQNRLEMTDSRYLDEVLTLKQLQSVLGDVDMAEAIMNYNVKEHVYQAALAAGARVMQPTLLDYLR